MALSFTGNVALSPLDLANLAGISIPAGSTLTQALTALGLSTSAVAAPLDLPASYFSSAPGSNGLFLGFGLPSTLPGTATIQYTSTATGAITAASITLTLKQGFRTGYNARRLAMHLDRLQNFLSAGFLSGTSAPNGRVEEAP